MANYIFTSGIKNLEVPGVTGAHLVWSQTDKSKTGKYYPPCLESSSSIFYFMFTIAPTPAISGPTNIGTPLGDLLGSSLFAAGIGVSQNSTWLTQHIISACRTAYEVNQPVILTQTMIDTGIITLPDCVFDFVSVTPEKIDVPPKIVNPGEIHLPVLPATIPLKLLFGTNAKWSIPNIPLGTFVGDVDAKIDEDTGVVTVNAITGVTAPSTQFSGQITATARNSSGEDTVSFKVVLSNTPVTNTVTPPTKEELEDQMFQALFLAKDKIPNNKFGGFVPNTVGIYYRLDSGMSKSINMMKSAGTPGGTGTGPNYSDGTSKEVKFNKLNFSAGDTVYLTYVAVKEHYFRQIIDVSWAAFDNGVLGFAAFPSAIRAANYRYFTWDVPAGLTSNNKASGWRVVETFNYKPNITGDIKKGGQTVFANVPGGDTSTGRQFYSYLPSNATAAEIKTSISTKKELAQSTITLPFSIGNNGYQVNSSENPITSDWYVDSLSLEEPSENYVELTKYCVFNTHPLAMQKRDVDKWAIPSILADNLSNAIKAGQESHFPFMDEFSVDLPYVKTKSVLNSNNFKISPLKSTPKIINLANATELTGDIGTVPGTFMASGGSSFGTSIFCRVSSNVIEERLEKGTHILVERFSVGGQATNLKSLITLDCKSSPLSFVTCISDKDFNNTYIFTTNDGFINYKKTTKSDFNKDLSNGIFDPIKGGIDQSTISVSQIDTTTYPIGGVSGILGQESYIYPLKTVGFQQYADNSIFKEFYSPTPKTNTKNTSKFVSAVNGNIVTIQFGETTYVGSIDISLQSGLNFKKEATLFFLSGNSIIGVADRISVLASNNAYIISLKNMYLMKCDSIQIKLEESGSSNSNIKTTVTSGSILAIDQLHAQDYNNEPFQITFIEDVPVVSGSMLAETDMASAFCDERGHSYLFFNDKTDGISCIHSHVEDIRFYLHAKFVKPIKDLPSRNPYVLVNHTKDKNGMFLFFQRNGSIYCCFNELSDLDFKDAFSSDPTQYVANSDAYIAAGNNDVDNISLLVNGDTRLKMGATTIFSNIPITTPFYTAYQNKIGELRLMFFDDSGLLQCNFSPNGISWNDMWQCMKLGQEGLVKQLDDLGNRAGSYPLGVNIHPTVTKGAGKPESPTAFCVPGTNRVFLFYIYKNCLLCNIFDDPVTCFGFGVSNCYDNFASQINNHPVFFVDGDASQIFNEVITAEVPKNNILFRFKDAASSFTSYRSVSTQRIAVYQMPNGQVRVFYKNSNGNLKAAHFDGSAFIQEDMYYAAGT